MQALHEKGHQISILAPEDTSVKALKDSGCQFLPLSMNPKGLNPIQDCALLSRLKKTFLEEQPNVILSYTIKNNIYGAIAARSAGIPFIPNVTGLGTAFLHAGPTQIIAQLLYRSAFNNVPIVFFQNEDDRDLFLTQRLVQDYQARLVPGSGVNLAHFQPAPYPQDANECSFLMISRFLRDKGVFEFAEAARIVKKTLPNARFQLLGSIDPVNRNAIDRKVLDAWVSEGLIEYLGFANDVRPYIAASACVVLPSYREGAPRSLIEAAAMARPVITTDVPGCRSVLDRDLSGFICAPKDAESLATAMFRFTALPRSNRILMGLSGRAKMEREFDQSIVIRSYINAISTLAEAYRKQ